MTEHTIYIGKLKNKQPLINLSGSFEKEDCDVAFNMTEALFHSGNSNVVFDCSGVVGVDKAWIEGQLRQLETRLNGMQIHVRKNFDASDDDIADSEMDLATNPPQKRGILDRIASRFVSLLGLERDTSELNHQTL